MRTFLFRGGCILLATLLVSSFFAVPAMAEEGEHREGRGHDGMSERDLKKVLKGLAIGIEALRAVGGQERAIGHLKELIVGLKKRHAMQRGEGKAKAAKRRDPERQKMGRMLELMLMAHAVLRDAGKREWAEIMEHSALAMKMLWSGRKDDEAMHVLSTAPSKERQVKGLNLAGEILADQGKKDRAHMLFLFGREMQGKGRKEPARKAKRKQPADRREAREEGDEDEERSALRKRVKTLRMAMPALREGERRDAAELLERAIHTGELLLEGREDAEAQRIYRQTPSLEQLAEVLHLASRLWREFKHPEQAQAVMKLSRYYAQRAKGDAEERQEHGEREEHGEAERRRHEDELERERRERSARDREVRELRREEHERRVREHREDGERAGGDAEAQIQQLRREMNEIQRALRDLMRQLRELASDRK